MSEEYKELLTKLKEKDKWETKQLLPLIGEFKNKVLSVKSFMFIDVKEVKEGDIVDFDIVGVKHPAIIIKILGESVHAVIISSKPKEYCTLAPVTNSRFFPDSYFTSTICSMDVSYAATRFLGIFDNMQLLEEVKQLLKEHYETIL